MTKIFASSIALLGLIGCTTATLTPQAQERQDGKTYFYGLLVDEVSPQREDKVVKSEKEWKAQLTDMQYKILRGHGTEAAFCGGYLHNTEKGVYHCIGCDLPLFKSDAKFKSGTGWPSFFQPYKRENIWLRTDLSYGMKRIEVLCARCDGHLGHLFADGPRDKTGFRFCINSEVLKFKPDQKR